MDAESVTECALRTDAVKEYDAKCGPENIREQMEHGGTRVAREVLHETKNSAVLEDHSVRCGAIAMRAGDER